MDQSPSSNPADNVKPAGQSPGSPPPDADSGAPSALTPSTWVILLILAVIVFLVYRNLGGLDGLIRSALIVFGIGFVIFIHELGHFLAAKWCDVHIQTFSIGFGPAIPGCSFQRGETTYKLAVLPLGGYVNMVGEGPEADEDEHYPRSFKNKTVGQRMLIISAGVVMNVLLGCFIFILVYTLHGVERRPAVVGLVDPGSPIWQQGIRTGSEITSIAGKEHPFFEDLKQKVVVSPEGASIPFTFYLPGSATGPRTVDLTPRRDENDSNPVIGVAPPQQLRIPPKPKKSVGKIGPTVSDSAAGSARPLSLAHREIITASTDPEHPDQMLPLKHDDKAHTFDYAELARRLRLQAGQPVYIDVLSGDEKVRRQLSTEGFQWDDQIVGCTAYPQEGTYSPFRVEALPGDPRNPVGDRRDPFLFQTRLVELAGKPMIIQVKREGQEAPVDLFVPPAYHRTFGMRMKMGKVAAVREGSPAEQAGIQKDDLLSKVRMVDEAGKTLYEEDPRKGLDPERLVDDLHKAARGPGNKKVILTVRRPEASGDHNEHRDMTLPAVPWQDSWDADREVPMSPSSPLAIPQLGVAYWITSHVVEVQPGKPADIAGLKANDELTDLRIQELNDAGTDTDWKPVSLSSKRQGKTTYDCWAHAFFLVQGGDHPKIQVKVSRDGQQLKDSIEIEALEDTTWPLAERGIRLLSDYQVQKADNLGQALVMGSSDTARFIMNMYLFLRSLFTGRVSPKQIGGPLEMLSQGFIVAGGDWHDILLYLAYISINLAVINFLPIPVLDGGHMVFLLYEKLRGRPPSEHIRIGATYAGLALILLLMIFVWYQDIRKHWFGG